MTPLVSGLFTREPAMVIAVVQAFIALVVSFGVGLTGEQVGAIVAFNAAVLGLITRSQVTPNETTVLAVEKAAKTGEVPVEMKTLVKTP